MCMLMLRLVDGYIINMQLQLMYTLFEAILNVLYQPMMSSVIALAK